MTINIVYTFMHLTEGVLGILPPGVVPGEDLLTGGTMSSRCFPRGAGGSV